MGLCIQSRRNSMEINIKPVVQCPGRPRSPVLVDPAGSSHQRRGGGGHHLQTEGPHYSQCHFQKFTFPASPFSWNDDFLGELSPAGLNCNCKLKLFFMSSLLLPPHTHKKKIHSEAEWNLPVRQDFEIAKAFFPLARGKGTRIFY